MKCESLSFFSLLGAALFGTAFSNEVLESGVADATNIYLEKNKAWADAQSPEDLAAWKEGQAPTTMYIGCADSRVAPERIMDMKVGEVFVHRNVGNIIYAGDDNAMSVLEYAIAALKIEHILVTGHYECGGVHAVLEENGGFDNLDRWLQQIRTIKAGNEDELNELDEEERWRRLVEYNAIDSAKVVNASKHVQKARDAGQSVFVHAWVHDIGSGHLEELEVFSEYVELPDYLGGNDAGNESGEGEEEEEEED